MNKYWRLKMGRKIRIGVLILIICGPMGFCSTFNHQWTNVDPATPDSELGHIRVSNLISIEAIDGQPMPARPFLAGSAGSKSWDSFSIMPGTYTLTIIFSRTEPVSPTTERKINGKIPLQITLNPGDVKSICPGFQLNEAERFIGWKPYVTEFPGYEHGIFWYLLGRDLRPKVPEDECK